MNLHYLGELQEAYMNNLLIPVIGRGLSTPIHLLDWKTLIIEVADQFSIADDDKQGVRTQIVWESRSNPALLH